MFTVGEFSQLAQVSKRLLRYYDEIGLLKPVRIDRDSGYRYYSADQMSDLNKILALKELGLSLDQIQRMMRDNVSISEMQGMLMFKKAEIELQLEAETQRLRKIESRLQSLRNSESPRTPNVIIKQTAEQPVMSVRTIIETFEVGIGLLSEIMDLMPSRNTPGLHFCICHSDGMIDRNIDIEMGFLIEEKLHEPLTLYNDLQLQYRKLPAVETMATTVVKGALETLHTGYSDIAMWVESNGYCIVGEAREIGLRLPERADGTDMITEIQYPVELLSNR